MNEYFCCTVEWIIEWITKMNKVREKTYCHQNLNKWGPNGDKRLKKVSMGTRVSKGEPFGSSAYWRLESIFFAFFGLLLHISLLILNSFLDTQVSLAPTHVSWSVRWLVRPSHFWISNLWSVTVDQIKKFQKTKCIFF